MISIEEVEKSILELEQADTSFAVCAKLADLYIVRDHLIQRQKAAAKVDVSGKSELIKTINGKDTSAVWGVVNDFVGIVGAMHPQLYANLIEELKKI